MALQFAHSHESLFSKKSITLNQKLNMCERKINHCSEHLETRPIFPLIRLKKQEENVPFLLSGHCLMSGNTVVRTESGLLLVFSCVLSFMLYFANHKGAFGSNRAIRQKEMILHTMAPPYLSRIAECQIAMKERNKFLNYLICHYVLIVWYHRQACILESTIAFLHGHHRDTQKKTKMIVIGKQTKIN